MLTRTNQFIIDENLEFSFNDNDFLAKFMSNMNSKSCKYHNTLNKDDGHVTQVIELKCHLRFEWRQNKNN